MKVCLLIDIVAHCSVNWDSLRECESIYIHVCICVELCRSSVMQAVAISSRGNMKFPVLLRCAATAQF